MATDRDPSEIMDTLRSRSPNTAFERFAKNFRNMGVVNHYERGGEEDVLIVYTSEKGMCLLPIRENGHFFVVFDTSYNADTGEIRHVLHYKG